MKWNSISDLRSVTCYMGSRSVTCHPVTRHKWTHPARQAGTVLDLPTPEGRKAELTKVIGYIPRFFTVPQTVTHPSTNPPVHAAGSWTHNLLITSPMPSPLHHQAILALSWTTFGLYSLRMRRVGGITIHNYFCPRTIGRGLNWFYGKPMTSKLFICKAGAAAGSVVTGLEIIQEIDCDVICITVTS